MRIAIFFIFFSKLFSNPFEIDFEKPNLTDADYQQIDTLLSQKNLKELMNHWYHDTTHELADISSFYNRINRGVNWNKFDKEDHPQKRRILINKINKGSENCVVSLCTFHKDYPQLLKQQIRSLKKSGFNGYHISFWGEFPNPTGKEIRYIAIPYVFKIFAMEYAHQLGFNNILWADSAMHFTNNPERLFKFIEKNGAYFQFYRNEPQGFRKKYITDIAFDSIFKILKSLSLPDEILDRKFIWAATFGLNFNTSLAKNFIEDYHSMIVEGLPFASGCTDETVLTAIIGQPKYADISYKSDAFELNENIVYSSLYEPMASGKKNLSIMTWQQHRHP